MVRRVPESHPTELQQTQWGNLFHTNLSKSFYSIVDSGSYCNCCISRFIDRLALTTIPRPRPYNLQWIKYDGAIVVKDQITIPI